MRPSPVPLTGRTDRSAAGAPGYRVLALAPTPFFADYGCHVRILEETLALQALGHQVTICTYPTGRDLPGLTVRRAPGLPGLQTIRVGSSKRKLCYDILLGLRALVEAGRCSPAIVHAHLHEGALLGFPLSRLWRAPLVFDFQGSLVSEMIDHHFLRRDSPLYGPLRGLERLITRLPDMIITSTRHGAGLLVRYFGCPAHKIVPVPDAVNLQRFRPRWMVPLAERLAHKQRLGIPLDRKVVVYLGLLAEYQGSGHLLQAAARVLAVRRDVHFLLMGYPGQDHYRTVAQSLGIADAVTFTGRVPYEEAPALLSLGDIAVSPKLARTEGNGKLLNYMAVGLPTVAYKLPASQEILGDLGVYARPGDVEGLAEEILALLDDETACWEIGRALRRRAETQFSWEQRAELLVAVYRHLLRD